MIRCLAVLGVLFLAGGAWPAQDQPAPTFKSGTDVVRIEASVLDRDRRPVRGLKAQDFVILENGREQPVVAFAPVDLPSPSTGGADSAAWVSDAPHDVASNVGTDAGRLVVIAFDWSIRAFDQGLARKIALAAVDSLGPSDHAAVVFTNPNAAAGKPQGFTGDRARLRAAINQPFAVALTNPHPDFSKRIIDPDRYLSGECLCGLCSLEAMTGLGHTLRTVSQRPKVVVYIGTFVKTFDAMVPTPLRPVIPGQITPSVGTSAGTTDCPRRLRDARRAFERSMGEANVTVHVVDPVGIDTESSTPLEPSRMRERLDSLHVMPDLTGGRTVTNTEAPDAQIAAILEESGSYYVLGFAPKSLTGGSRRLEVHVRPSHLTVRARTHYNPAEQPTAAPPQHVLTRALSSVLPARDVPFTVSAAPMVAGGRSVALLTGRVNPGTARPSAMLVAAFTPRAAPVVSRRIVIPPSDAPPAPSALGFVATLPLEPGSYEIRVATETEGGASGSVHTFLDVLDFKRAPLAMSGVVLHVEPPEPVASRAEIDGVLPFVPSARRIFGDADDVSAIVQVVQGTTRRDVLQPVSLLLRITDVRGAVVRTQTGTLGVEEFGNGRTANARLSLPLRDLPPGQYLLTLEGAAANHRADRSLRFEVSKGGSR